MISNPFVAALIGTLLGKAIVYPFDFLFMGAGMPWLVTSVFPALARFLRWAI
jgi:hypothetical protein